MFARTRHGHTSNCRRRNARRGTFNFTTPTANGALRQKTTEARGKPNVALTEVSVEANAEDHKVLNDGPYADRARTDTPEAGHTAGFAHFVANGRHAPHTVCICTIRLQSQPLTDQVKVLTITMAPTSTASAITRRNFLRWIWVLKACPFSHGKHAIDAW